MLFSSAVTLLSSAVLASAQYGYGPGPAPASTAPAATSAAAAAAPSAPANTNGTVNVDVGFQQTFTFHPTNFTAPNGTIVTFFFPIGLSHSVTQSSLANPCTYLTANSTSGDPAGFDSGLQQGVQFSINITDDTKPIYFHCKAPTHCGTGMVGAINAPATGTGSYDDLFSAAKAIGANEVTETDNGPVTSGVDAIATAVPSNSVSVGGSGGSSGSGSSSATSLMRDTVLMMSAVALLMCALA